MILAFNESLCDMDGLTALQVSPRDFYCVTRNGFVVWYQWRDADGVYSFGERSCSFVSYTKHKDGSVTCSRECHIGKTVLMLEYLAPKMAHKVNDEIQMRYLFPKVSFKALLTKVFG